MGITESAALVAGLTDRMLKLYFLLAAAVTGTSLAQECCPTKVVAGTDSLAGTYNLYGPANFLDICQDQCAYKREGNMEDTYCFKTQGATHSTECLATGSTPAGSTASSGGGGSCPYSKDNVSWGEYQAKIPMPSGTSPPYTVVITFDADTTIGSCHSNCDDISCSGAVCTISYQGTNDMEMFNIRKTDAAGDNDRSNMVSVTINGAEQC